MFHHLSFEHNLGWRKNGQSISTSYYWRPLSITKLISPWNFNFVQFSKIIQEDHPLFHQNAQNDCWDTFAAFDGHKTLQCATSDLVDGGDLVAGPAALLLDPAQLWGLVVILDINKMHIYQPSRLDHSWSSQEEVDEGLEWLYRQTSLDVAISNSLLFGSIVVLVSV